MLPHQTETKAPEPQGKGLETEMATLVDEGAQALRLGRCARDWALRDAAAARVCGRARAVRAGRSRLLVCCSAR